MIASVTLLVTRGPSAGRQFSFDGPACCTIGRARDCTIALPLEPEHLDVSRHHCLLEIVPPAVRVRDLGSLNGTFVNGRKIGQRSGREATADHGPDGSPLVELGDGDEIQLGENTAFRLCVRAPVGRPEDDRTCRASSGELPAFR